MVRFVHLPANVSEILPNPRQICLNLKHLEKAYGPVAINFVAEWSGLIIPLEVGKRPHVRS